MYRASSGLPDHSSQGDSLDEPAGAIAGRGSAKNQGAAARLRREGIAEADVRGNPPRLREMAEAHDHQLRTCAAGTFTRRIERDIQATSSANHDARPFSFFQQDRDLTAAWTRRLLSLANQFD